jgi:hypothetical protein
VKIFLKYFLRQWKDKLPGWYEGYAPLHPSTKNGLQSTNRWIKANQFREKLPLNEFLRVFMSLATKWLAEPTLGLSNWTEACQWIKLVEEKNTLVSTSEEGSI